MLLLFGQMSEYRHEVAPILRNSQAIIFAGKNCHCF
jgi:hypothetical protein